MVREAVDEEVRLVAFEAVDEEEGLRLVAFEAVDEDSVAVDEELRKEISEAVDEEERMDFGEQGEESLFVMVAAIGFHLQS